jgi:uncharacterized cupin superfamily protein
MAMPAHPACIAHWSEIERPDERHYDGDDELMSIGAPLGGHFGLTKLGIHHERLPPGRRTSFPHAESTEEEFVYVIDGEPDVWLDGHLHRLKAGDAVWISRRHGDRAHLPQVQQNRISFEISIRSIRSIQVRRSSVP